MLEMPRSLMSTSGWFFSRLSSTNFFRDLDMTWTKPQQSTWATARRVQGEKGGSPGWHSPVFPRSWEAGSGGQGLGTRMGGGERGAEKWGGSSTIPAAEKQTQLQPHTHTHCGGLHLIGTNYRLLQGSLRWPARDALGRCKTSTQARNTPCPGTPRRRTSDR